MHLAFNKSVLSVVIKAIEANLEGYPAMHKC